MPRMILRKIPVLVFMMLEAIQPARPPMMMAAIQPMPASPILKFLYAFRRPDPRRRTQRGSTKTVAERRRLDRKRAARGPPSSCTGGDLLHGPGLPGQPQEIGEVGDEQKDTDKQQQMRPEFLDHGAYGYAVDRLDDEKQ